MDDKNGTLVGLRDLLRKAAAKNGHSFDVDASTPTAHFADGGEVQGESPIIVALRNYIMGHSGNAGADQQMASAADVVDSTGTAKNFADGGEVAPDPMAFLSNGFMTPAGRADQMPPAPMPAPPPVAPPAAPAPALKDVALSLNSAPDTDYNFFKDLSASDRAALQQKLVAQQTSAPNMIAQGVAGLGDAISNSFGGKNTTFQKDAMTNNELQQKKQLDAFDTQRSQKMQDMNANMEMQSNDPNSPLSQSMRKIVASQGVQVGSKMPASMMMKVLGPLGELAMKQATLDQQKALQQQTIDIAKQGQKTKQDEVGFQEDKEAATHWLLDPKGAAAARSRLAKGSVQDVPAPHGIPELGATFNGGQVLSVKRIK